MVLVAQLGARMHYAVPAILARSGKLERLCTDICAPRLPEPLRTMAARFGPEPLRRWLGRVPADIAEARIVSFPAMGFEYYRRRRFASAPGSETAAHLWAGRELCHRVIASGLGDASGVYTYNSAGLELLQYARAMGKLAVMEQTIASGFVQDKLFKEEEKIHGSWTLSHEADPLRAELNQRERSEWEAASLILCGSEFVRDSIGASGGPVQRCRVVPYGINGHPSLPRRERRHHPLRIFTAGEVGLRKGSPYVLFVAQMLKGRAEFRMAGALNVTPFAEKLLRRHVTLLGAVPRSEMYRHFAWADLFLLPTLCEGSATVCYEALAHGLPVITTPNAGSVVRDGREGFIVPIRNAAAIADRIECLAEDGALWTKMSTNALARAAEYTLEKYGVRLLSALRMAGSGTFEDISQAQEILQ
jgi:glycosyltransferase involved in cell wall biosynthesis